MFDWLPGVAVALMGSGIGFLTSTKVSAAVTDQKIAALREEFTKHEASNERLEGALASDLKCYFDKLNAITTKLEVTMSEQSAFTQIATKALEGATQKLEFHESALVYHDKEIALLKAKLGGPQ